MLHYNCPVKDCGWEVEDPYSNTDILQRIFDHEKEHAENDE